MIMFINLTHKLYRDYNECDLLVPYIYHFISLHVKITFIQEFY